MQGVDKYQDFLRRELAEVDPDMQHIIELEEERQARRLIFIPSESMCLAPVREALGSVFTNIYAEGYPSHRMMHDREEHLLDFAYQLAIYRRYSDRRFYKGTEYVDIIESLAERRCAELFANEHVRAEDIHVNVQPLSGAAANLAIYDAVMQPGDTLMGMDLFQGGHLTHGSQFNISGRRYQVVSYGVDPKTDKLDYDAILTLAKEHKPKVIVAGFTSYPWAPDWAKFREAADACGAILMADIAHIAGMVSAGVVPSPIGYADVVSFTTHKTMCGPRGAVIMTADESIARRLDSAVFPGAQGGPHTNKFAAMAVAFKIAGTPEFKELQRNIVDNAKALAAALQANGMKLAYGGTDTHLMVVDLKGVKTPNGEPLFGEPAVRIMDLCGLVANKNTIPGDHETALATGVRLGTPWLSQRGFKPEDMERIAGLLSRVLTNIYPFTYTYARRETPRGKITLEVMEEVKREVDAVAASGAAETRSRGTGYPHFPMMGIEPVSVPDDSNSAAVLEAAQHGLAALDLRGMALFKVSGRRAWAFLQEATTGNLINLEPGHARRTFLLGRSGELLADAVIWRFSADRRLRDRYVLVVRPEVKERLAAWLRGLSDGYTLFDTDDVLRKLPGPVLVEELSQCPDEELCSHGLLAITGPRAAEFVQRLGALPAEGESWSGNWGDIAVHVARLDLDPSAPRYEVLVECCRAEEGLSLLTQAGAEIGGVGADTAVRRASNWPTFTPDDPLKEAVALYQAQPGYFDLSQPYFIGQRSFEAQLPNLPTPKPAFAWEEREGETKQTALYQAHVALKAKMAPFAGWEMPLWYSSVTEEHRAVRQAAGLFDVSHMGVFDVAGEKAAEFLDTVFTNYAGWLQPGKSMYGYLMDPDGHCLDDIMVYQRSADRYLVVVNAANEDKDFAWLQAVNSGEVMIDRANPAACRTAEVTIRNLRAPEWGEDRLVDLALQGPESRSILLKLVKDREDRRTLLRLHRTDLGEVTLRDIPVVVARTGYTGERIAYELFVHPDQALALWSTLLEAGEPLGLRPCGLAARDSLRIEAGLLLYGHDLDGPHDIVPAEAGYGPFVKLFKGFFVGRSACVAQKADHELEVVRFRLDRAGTRAIHQDDPVVNRQGSHIGWVTSCTLVSGMQMGMALIQKRYAEPGAQIGIFALPQGRTSVSAPSWSELELGERILLHEWATILTRFPNAQERSAWRPPEQ